MNRVCFVGSAGSGKSTLAAEVFVDLKKRNLNAELIAEWVRSDLHANGPMTNIWEQYRTLNHQRAMEDAVPSKVNWVVTDTGTLAPYFYASLYVDHNAPRQRLVLQDMHRYLLNDLYGPRYSHIFFIPMAETYRRNPDILNDGTRFQTREQVETLERHMDLIFNRLFNLDNVYVLTQPLHERLRVIMDILQP